MKRKGPKGYWAYAKWNIRWSGTCRVTLKINYTMPRWKNKNNAPKRLQKSWNKMIINLKRHEEGHGLHGINAANAIVKAKCNGSNRIITKWAKQDKVFDKKTGHGRKQGVVLR
ncbi:MAG: DUF922 domain-containing Zn-dependent protease [Chloroflexi bacterium]|nr:DUF922 domain-containing Zn-dependent protease [Chloroflexota bacterium]